MPADDFWILMRLRERPDRLKQWIMNSIRRRRNPNSEYEHHSEEMLEAIGSLDLTARCQILEEFPADIPDLLAGDVVDALVAGDVQAFEVVCRRDALKHHREGALGDEMDDQWVRRAEVALAYGIEPRRVMAGAGMPLNRITSSWGGESTHWSRLLAKSRDLAAGPTEAHRLLGRAGVEIYQEQLDSALEKERKEAVYGDW
jgi:hypothetical protein